MSTKKSKKDKGLIVKHTQKTEKETCYLYPLKNGQILEFPTKTFPTDKQLKIINQLELF